MRELLKYEMRKTRVMKLIALGITAVAELIFLIALLARNQEGNTDEILGICAVLLVFITFGSLLLIGIQSIVTLHRDMNTKQGYMLYMTPRSSWQIVGAKMLENGLSLALTGGFFFLLGLLDVTLLLSRMGQLAEIWRHLTDLLHSINADLHLDSRDLLCLTAELLASWLATVSIAFLADIISSALLNGKKFNGIITFLFFIVLTVLLNVVQHKLVPAGTGLQAMLLLEALIALCYSAIMYVAAVQVMDAHLSV
ncbi:MAG: hypothetical protein J5564_02375 [Clostridia bacterium]|nr:hypothetical protein [Clostridia bacterium]